MNAEHIEKSFKAIDATVAVVAHLLQNLDQTLRSYLRQCPSFEQEGPSQLAEGGTLHPAQPERESAADPRSGPEYEDDRVPFDEDDPPYSKSAVPLDAFRSEAGAGTGEDRAAESGNGGAEKLRDDKPLEPKHLNSSSYRTSNMVAPGNHLFWEFLTGETVPGPGKVARLSKFCKSFQDYCLRNNYIVPNRTGIRYLIHRNGIQIIRACIKGTHTNFVEGLELKE